MEKITNSPRLWERRINLTSCRCSLYDQHLHRRAVVRSAALRSKQQLFRCCSPQLHETNSTNSVNNFFIRCEFNFKDSSRVCSHIARNLSYFILCGMVWKLLLSYTLLRNQKRFLEAFLQSKYFMPSFESFTLVTHRRWVTNVNDSNDRRNLVCLTLHVACCER